jgi:hypothetical protein
LAFLAFKKYCQLTFEEGELSASMPTAFAVFSSVPEIEP